MAATQRLVTREALTTPSGERSLWREVPSWFLIGDEDRNLPAALQRFMAQRAGARRAIELPARHTRSPSHVPRRQLSSFVEAATVALAA